MWRFSFLHVFFAWYHRQRLLVQQRLTAYGYFHSVPVYCVLLERTDLVKKLFFYLAFAIQEWRANAGTWMYRCFPFNSPTCPWCYWRSFVSSCIKICAEKNRTLGLCMTPGLIHTSLQLTHVLLLRMKLIVKENQAHCMKFKPSSSFFLLFSLSSEVTWKKLVPGEVKSNSGQD